MMKPKAGKPRRARRVVAKRTRRRRTAKTPSSSLVKKRGLLDQVKKTLPQAIKRFASKGQETVKQLTQSHPIQHAIKGVVKQVGRRVIPRVIERVQKRPREDDDEVPPVKRGRFATPFSPMDYREKSIQRGAGTKQKRRDFLF